MVEEPLYPTPRLAEPPSLEAESAEVPTTEPPTVGVQVADNGADPMQEDQAIFGDRLDYAAGGRAEPQAKTDEEIFGDRLDYSQKPSDNEDQAIAIGQSAVGTAVETGGLVAGAAKGFALTAPVPILGARVAGTIIGGGIGWWLGHEVRGGLSDLDIPGTDIAITRENLEAFPKDQQKAAIVGEVLAGGYTVSGATVKIAKSGFRFGESFVGNFFNRILKNADQTTKVFLMGESAGTTGAATGAVIAEEYDPGDKLTRFSMEVAVGIANPVRIATGFYNKFADMFKQGMRALPTNNRIGQAFREDKVAETIQEALVEADGDPVLLSKLLDSAGVQGTGPQTSAVKAGVADDGGAGSSLLAEFQAAVGRQKGEFAYEADEMMQANLDNVDRMIRALRTTSDPSAIKQAAAMEAAKFDMLVQARFAKAQRAVEESVGDISKLGQAARPALSRQAMEIVREVKTSARAAEHELWENIPGHVKVLGGDLVEEADIIMKELSVTGEDLPGPLRFFIDKINAPGSDGTVTMAEMVAFRKSALAHAGDAAASTSRGAKRDAGFYSRMAESVLVSMDSTFGTPDSPRAGLNRMLGLSADAYTAARSFSKSFNDAFTRTFAGHTLRKNAQGTMVVPDELVLQRGLASGGDEGAMRLRELQEATEFMKLNDIGDAANADELVKAMHLTQENMVRILALKYVDPITNRVTPKSMKKFMDDSPELMERFPELAKDLKRALRSEADFANIGVTGALPGRAPLDATRVGRQQAAFAEAGGFDNSVAAVRAALHNKNPEKALSRLTELAKKGGIHAQEGLRASVFDNVFDEMGKISNNFDYTKMRAAFFDPIQTGGADSMMDIMIRSRVFDKADAKRLTILLDEADKIGRVKSATGRAVEGAVEHEADMITTLLTKVLGSTATTKTAKYLGLGGAGAGIIIAGAGSNAATRALDRVPQTAIRDVLIEALTKPKFMSMLLRKPITPKDTVEHNRAIHAYLVQALFIPLRGNEEDEELPLPKEP